MHVLKLLWRRSQIGEAKINNLGSYPASLIPEQQFMVKQGGRHEVHDNRYTAAFPGD